MAITLPAVTASLAVCLDPLDTPGEQRNAQPAPPASVFGPVRYGLVRRVPREPPE